MNVIPVLIFAWAALPSFAQTAAPTAKKARPAGAAQTRAGAGGIPASYKDLKYPPLNPIKVPASHKHTLANGMTLFLVRDSELPTVRAQAMIRTGERYEPIEKAGVAEITLHVMRTGGTPTRNGDDLDKELDRLAASVETSSGVASASASVFSLKGDAGKMLAILADILQNPAFPQDKIDLVKTDMRDTISRRNDDPMGIHGRENQRLLYGKDSPYTRQAEYSTLDSISRADLVAFHKEYFHPENVTLAVWGDFDPTEMKGSVERIFGSWPKGGKPRPATPAVDVAKQSKGMHLINKQDSTQSVISASFLLGRMDDPDYPALTVMTSVLGGGFGSRLFDNIRTKQGLAYMTFAGYTPRYDYTGTWTSMTGTKTETTIKALESMREEIRRMRETEITDAELDRARNEILKAEAFDFDSTGKIINRMMTYDFFGYPADFLQKTRAGIERTTKADVLRVAKKWLNEDRFTFTVLGKPEGFEKPLDSLGLGAVKTVDITIPGPKDSAPAVAPTAGGEARGKELLAKARGAHGGAALAKVKAYATKMDSVMVTPQGEMAMKAEGIVSLTGKSRMKMMAPFGEMIQSFDGKTLWMKTPQGTQAMPESMVAQARQTAGRETVSLLSRFDSADYKVQAIGTQKLSDKDVEAVAVTHVPTQAQFRALLDPETGMLVGKIYTAQMMGPPAEITESYLSIREVDGIKVPFHTIQMAGGQKRAEFRMAEFKVNPETGDSTFAKPE